MPRDVAVPPRRSGHSVEILRVNPYTQRRRAHTGELVSGLVESVPRLAHKVLRSLTTAWSAVIVTLHNGVRARTLGVSRPVARRATLCTLFVVLLVLWFLGVVSSYTLGGFIHLLLVLALIAVVLQLIQGRRVV